MATGRTIALSGDATGSTTFDGSTNKNITVTLASSGVSAGTYNNVTVDAKGRVTSGSNASYAASNHNHNSSYLSLSGGTCTGAVKAPSFQISSDIRLKSDLQKINNALDKVSQLTAYTYNKQEIKTRQAGLIAQDVEKILPEAVDINDDGYKTIDYQAVTALLINAINELRQKYESLAV